QRVVADNQRDERCEGAGVDRVRSGVFDIVRSAQDAVRPRQEYAGVLVELLRRVDLQREVRFQEDQPGQMGGVGVGLDELGERVRLELGVEVHSGSALQVIEPVSVLQLLHLVLEHEVEGRAQQAAERGDLLGQAADPEVNAAEAGGRN